MALLKKIKASTLMETMVATVLIVVLFMMTSMLLNSFFTSKIENNTSLVQERLNELEYDLIQDRIIVPYFEDWQQWEIRIVSVSSKDLNYYVLEATNSKTKRISTSYVYKNE